MFIGLAITFGYIFFLWLFFARLKLLTFSPTWAFVSFYFGLHLLLLFIIPPRFYQPGSRDARVIRHTIQLVPRLPEPTLLTEVFVEPHEKVKKGAPLFQFDKRLYEYQRQQAAAQLAAARQNVLVLKADVDAAVAAVAEAKAEQDFAQDQVVRFKELAKQGAGRVEQLQEWQDKLVSANAAIRQAEANQQKATLQYESQIDGVNTAVAEAEAGLKQAEYYVEQTTILAPEDGYITNLQARPGLVVGQYRVGAIASFVCSDEPYILATYYQEHLKYVKPGQPVEIALDTHPGEIFTGKVDAVWQASGQGQMLPGSKIPTFRFPELKGRFAVRILMDDPALQPPAGVQGATAIYTDQGTSFSIIRRVEIRFYTWKNFLYPLSI